MAYKLHIQRYRSQNHELASRIAVIITLFLILNAVGVINSSDFLMLISLNALLGLMIFLFFKIESKNQVPFIMIQDSKLEYFCPEKNKIITVFANDITNITTRFFELRIHTAEKVHSINLEQVTEEKTRWEIKEMIKQLANVKAEMHIAHAN